MVCTESPAPTPVVALTLGSCRTFGADLRTPEHQLFASLYLYLCVGVIPTPEGPESRCCATFGSHYQPFRMDQVIFLIIVWVMGHPMRYPIPYLLVRMVFPSPSIPY